MPIPSVAPAAAGAAPAGVPMAPRPYGYQKVPVASVERRIPTSGNRGLTRVVTTAVILMVCFFIGSGIYYFFSRTEATPIPNSSLDTTTLVTADKTPPTISGFNVSNITESSATITWTTDEPATSHVEYGKTETYGSTTRLDTKLAASHSATLTRLDSSTHYNFRVVSKDASGNEAKSATNQTFQTLTPEPAQEGNRAPDFTLQNLKGEDVTLSSFRGKTVMINFWAVWCDPCVKELPSIQNVSKEWSSKGLVVLAIAVKENEQLDTVEQYITQNSYTFPVLFDSQGINSVYNATYLPTTFFIDTEGIIKKIQVGSFENQAAIEKILNPL
jgi:peroxiredoxin